MTERDEAGMTLPPRHPQLDWGSSPVWIPDQVGNDGKRRGGNDGKKQQRKKLPLLMARSE